MNIIEQHVSSAKKQPVLTGVLAVVAVLSAGMGMAFATGLTAPELAKAIIIGPPCCVTTPPPPVVVPPPPVVVPPPPPPVVDVGPPCCTTTPPPPVVVPPPPPVVPPTTPPVIDVGPPCCTTTPPPPVVVPPPPPPVVTPPPPVQPQPPVVPPVIPPVIPPTIPPPVDICPNLSGMQTSIPSGYIMSNGNCIQPPVDVCPNLSGVQTSIPAGYTKDGNGNCVQPPPDLCPNVAGTQNVVPAGYVVDSHGNCVVPQTYSPVCELSASPSQIDKGSSATLTWNTDNATSVSINQGIGSVALDGTRSVSPADTTTYTLTATGHGKTVTCSTTVIVKAPKPAPVCQLSASPSQINKGGTSLLSWSTQNAHTVSINQGIGSVSLNGTQSVSPTQTTTYTLTATGHGGTVTCTTTVTVVHQPDLPVCTLTALPTTITKGGAATLSWTTQNATSVSINQGIGSVSLNGNRSVMPTQTTTYTLTATGPGGTVNCEKTITVIIPQPEPVCTLTISPTHITRGGSAVISWTTQNATSASIDQGIGSVPLNGSRTITPTESRLYTLTATGNGKTVTCAEEIHVTVIPEAPVCTLTALPTTITKGGAATLSWTTDRADTVSINQGIGGVALDGSRSVMPTQTTTYTLTATGHGKTVTCATTITVVEPEPELPVCQLTISPSTITRGASATLAWETTNAHTVSIDQGIGGVALDGSRSVSPNENTKYLLTATGEGGTVKCDVHITVTDIPTPPSCFLNVNPDDVGSSRVDLQACKLEYSIVSPK